MADDTEDEEEEPAVELGEGEPVEGAPVARVASRLTWPKERSAIDELEGESVVRTPDGPRELSDILAETETTYYGTRQDFVDAIERVIGTGPVPTADE